MRWRVAAQRDGGGAYAGSVVFYMRGRVREEGRVLARHASNLVAEAKSALALRTLLVSYCLSVTLMGRPKI